MAPIKAAIQLSKVWRALCGDGSPYPVDCRLLAEALNIMVYSEPIDDKFEAMLNIRGKQRVIIYNESIRQEGRKNFCISHELGHHSCHSERDEFRCSMKDLNDMAPHPENIEQEANLFAANLLMPADDFRAQVSDKRVSLAYLGELAEERYKTSLTATCNRLINLSPRSAFGMVVVKGDEVAWWARTEEMRFTGFSFRSRQKVSKAGLTHNPNCEPIESDIWLNEKNAPRWSLKQSAIYMPYYDQTLVLLEAQRGEGSEYWKEFDEPDPTPPRIPSFK